MYLPDCSHFACIYFENQRNNNDSWIKITTINTHTDKVEYLCEQTILMVQHIRFNTQ